MMTYLGLRISERLFFIIYHLLRLRLHDTIRLDATELQSANFGGFSHEWSRLPRCQRCRLQSTSSREARNRWLQLLLGPDLLLVSRSALHHITRRATTSVLTSAAIGLTALHGGFPVEQSIIVHA